jgi:hypothetical protein
MISIATRSIDKASVAKSTTATAITIRVIIAPVAIGKCEEQIKQRVAKIPTKIIGFLAASSGQPYAPPSRL